MSMFFYQPILDLLELAYEAWTNAGEQFDKQDTSSTAFFQKGGKVNLRYCFHFKTLCSFQAVAKIGNAYFRIGKCE